MDNKRQIVLAVFLCIIVVWYIADSGLFSGKDVSETVAELTENISGQGDRDLEYVKKYSQTAPIRELLLTTEWVKDPFYYVSEDEDPDQNALSMAEMVGEGENSRYPPMILTGISQNGNTGFAMVRSRVVHGEDTSYVSNFVKEGEAIGGFKVSHIAFDYVVLKQGTRSLRLRLRQ